MLDPTPPPFTITPAVLTLVAEIAGEVGRLGAMAGLGCVPKLRRENRIPHRPTFRANCLHPALNQGFIERTIPDKPNSQLQKYRLTEKARACSPAKT